MLHDPLYVPGPTGLTMPPADVEKDPRASWAKSSGESGAKVEKCKAKPE